MVETIEAQIQAKLGKYGKPHGVRPLGLCEGLGYVWVLKLRVETPRTITDDGCYFSEVV